MKGFLLSVLLGAVLSVSLAMPVEAASCDVPADPPDDGQARHFGVFATVPGDPSQLALDGEIGPATAEDFQCALRGTPQARLLVLNSTGGAVDAALDIAYEVQRLGISTYVPQGSYCFSACTFIFLAGAQRAAIGPLGVHQLRYDRGGKAHVKVRQALRAFGADSAVFTAMMLAPPDELFVFNAHSLAHLNINNGDPLASVGGMPEGGAPSPGPPAPYDGEWHLAGFAR